MRSPRSGRAAAAHPARGLSLVELLIGIAVGLVMVASAATFLAGNLRESRALLLESRLMQDLRTAADVVTRDLRRAGYWAAATDGIWRAGAASAAANPYAALSPSATASDSVSFAFSRDAVENNGVDSNEQFGFRLRNGTLEMQLGATNWQALTDSGTLAVTAFTVSPGTESIGLADACPEACPVGSTTCPPRLAVRSLAVRISGRSITDPGVERSVRSAVRVRNDGVFGACV